MCEKLQKLCRLSSFLAPSAGAAARRFWCATMLFLLLLVIAPINQAQTQQLTKPAISEPIPQPAMPAILAVFDKYEVVAMPQGHGMQDLDNFIFSLIRNPAFSQKVNDIVFESGNSLYQPILDRYIAGEDVPFTEVQKVWRKMGQPAAGASAFVEQFYPLVRALNQKLPPGRRLRLLAGDPPIDWDQVKSFDDVLKQVPRDVGIASVMENEVLSKHRKALMLFGTFHIMHNARGTAVSIYEKHYPNVTFVITELGAFDTNLSSLSESKFVTWPIPALARVKGTWLGALSLDQLIPPPTMIDMDCHVLHEYPATLPRSMQDLVDAFLYLGPQDLRLSEKMPADIALDATYRAELQRGGAMLGYPDAASETPAQFDEQIVKSAEKVIFAIPKLKHDPKGEEQAVQACRERKSRINAPQ